MTKTVNITLPESIAIELLTIMRDHEDRGTAQRVTEAIEEGLRHSPEPTARPVEPFVVKHYATDLRPIIKGNGFDGLEVGIEREDAEDFVNWLNGRLGVNRGGD